MKINKFFKFLKIIKSSRFWIAIALTTLSILCIIGPLKIIFEPLFLSSYLQKYDGYVEIIFIIIYTLITIVGIPGTVLTIAGGSLFGLWQGTIVSIISATLGALCAFWTARYLLQDYVEEKFGKNKRLASFQQAVANKPFAFVLAVRFVPISPYNLVNYLFALTPINWLSYTVATFIGVIPGSLAYTWIGVSGTKALQGGERTSLFLALTLLTLISAIPIFTRGKKKL